MDVVRTQPTTARRISRRRFLQATAALAVTSAVGLGSYTRWIGPFGLRIAEYEMPIAHLPRELEGKRMVQISDLHIGPDVDDEYLAKCFRSLRDLKADLLVITGDLISYVPPGPWEKVKRHLEALGEFPLGRVAILGNHDYGEWWQPEMRRGTHVEEKISTLYAEAGIKLLRNESTKIKGLEILGVEDFWTSYFDPSEVFAGLKSDAPRLMLCHNPDGIDTPIFESYRGWILSGHTHGGQCWFPVVGAPITPVQNKRYVQGHIQPRPGVDLFINPGLGYLRQVRFLVPPEISVFTLRSAV